MLRKRNKTSSHTGYLRTWLVTLTALVLIVAGSVAVIRTWYFRSLKPLNISATATTNFSVSEGESVRKISQNLSKAHLIRSAKAFETYVRSNGFNGHLQAGVYELSPSMSVQQIAKKMVSGDVAKKLLTILPGKRLDEIEQAFAKAGYSQTEIDSAFNPANYSDIALLKTLPAGASLEGYLYPDSFDKAPNTPASSIVRQSLLEMDSHLTPDIRQGFSAQGLDVYQGVTLASIVARETSDANFEKTVAQVFLTRLKDGMPLGSDVTALYAAALAGQPGNLAVDSPYNTRLHTGLPPGPIGNVSSQPLEAVAHPSNSSYLYFVAGDDGVMHFSYTEAQHEQAIQQYCKKSCG